jgi:hypothetical protein
VPLNRFGAAVATVVVIGVAATAPNILNRPTKHVQRAAAMTCVPHARLYGTAPAGFEYVTLKGGDRREIIEDLGLEGDDFRKVDIAVAQGPEDDDTAVLVAIPRSSAADGLDDYVAGAKESGRDVTRETLAGHDAARIENPDGSKLLATVKGCHIVIVIAPDETIVKRVAPAVFAA